MTLNKRRIAKGLFLIFLIVGTVYVLARQQSMPYHTDNGKIFGTIYNITYQSDKTLSDQIYAALQEVDNTFSMFNKSSIVSKINRNEDVETNEMLEDVFALAKKVAQETDGAFDSTVAPLVNLWGFGFKQNEEPSAFAIDSIRSFIGYKMVSLKDNHIIKEDKRTMLDFGAIAKGFACDAVARVLRSYDVQNYMIEIGGEIVVRGKNKQGKNWKIGITKPDDEESGTLQEVMSVSNCAIATSGNYRNYYYKDGKKYAHTIDPRTGLPVDHTLLSATVVAPSCAMADAYATAFMVIGLDEACKILEKNRNIHGYLVYTDTDGQYKVWCSQKINKMISSD